MKNTCLLMVLVAMACLATDADAARRARVNQAAVMEPMGEGTFYLEVDEPFAVSDEPAGALHWNPRRGFHVDVGCCRENDGRSARARVSVQRFAGIDPTVGRPIYVGSRGRF